MKKTVLFIIALLSFATVSSSAFTVLVVDFIGSGAGFTQNPIVAASGAAMPNGSGRVRIGFFPTMTHSQVGSMFPTAFLPTAIPNINANFVPLGEGLDPELGGPGGTGGAAPPRFALRTINSLPMNGRLAGSLVNVAITPGAFSPQNIIGVPAGTRLYMIVYNGSTDATTSELGIFSADTWLTPSDNLVSPVLNTVDVNTSGEVIIGSFSTSLTLGAFIPEPSTGLLGILAGAGLLLRRRR